MKLTKFKRPANVGFSPRFNSFFDDFFTKDLTTFRNNFLQTSPSVNIADHGDRFEIEVAAPGMKKSDFNLELDNDMLTIRAEMKNENEVQEETYMKREFSYGSFQRSFHLPDYVSGEKIEAKYKDGILVVTLPKKEEAVAQPAREIKVS